MLQQHEHGAIGFLNLFSVFAKCVLTCIQGVSEVLTIVFYLEVSKAKSMIWSPLDRCLAPSDSTAQDGRI